MIDLTTKFLGLVFKNPFVAGAGALGYGDRRQDWTNLESWGGISLKGLTLQPRAGNPHPRLKVLPYGMINSIGLRNPGWDWFLKHYHRELHHLKTNLIINLNGGSIDELLTLVGKVQHTPALKLIEINLSCPNVTQEGMTFGHDPEQVYQLTRQVRQLLPTQKLIVKLSGTLVNLVTIARAAERGGADAISLVNSVPAMLIDSEHMRPVLGNTFGGLSGAAIKPIALRAVYQVFTAVKIPIIGMGGVTCAQDAIELILAGASIVELGSILWTKPQVLEQIMSDFRAYLVRKQITRWQSIIGKAH